MARVPYLGDEEMNLRRAMANTTGGAKAISDVVRWLRNDTKLDKRLCEMAILQVARLTGSRYEWVQHVELARKVGVPDAYIRAIGGDESALDALTRAVLRGAREMTEGIAMSDATFGELRDGLGVEPLMELVIAISFYVGTARLLETLQVDVEPRMEPLLDAFPLEAK
jgi:alkylhydroperoxidase family enzyme